MTLVKLKNILRKKINKIFCYYNNNLYLCNEMKRTVEISIEKAKEWYKSGNASLKEVALQAFEESELMIEPWETIKTYEDACRALWINPNLVDFLPSAHLKNMYKLQIVKGALNGVYWTPELNTGTIYYPWMRYYPKGNSYDSIWKPVANFKAKEDNKVYTLVVGNYNSCGSGLGSFGGEYGVVNANRGLLGCKSKEIAEYFGITFGKLIFDAVYGQYKNYEWVE